ncbi:hypothetical protein CKO42_17230 [Lamprobacter modestohalophilus]|uniref:CRISPR-associated protein Csx10 n=1 Tax=Lamprobacter modestohalophilus TaxID=1064514 RepID=A0A9X0WB42_9GAMM|nr:hypothetical protein [Lamprobacter modestohalophilus]MBK1620152.1 hypothetical protein [Lamprobacter modestohalophilus]
MKVVTYRVRLRQPLLVAGRTGDPNTVRSLDYLPGSTLRGALIGRYAQSQGQARRCDATDADFRRLFFTGAARFLNAYPEQDGKRSLPTPLSWRRPKDDANRIQDFALEPPPPQDMTQWQRVGAPFMLAADEEDGTEVMLLTPEREINLHTQRDRLAGRATEDAGDIFNYDCLAPEQQLIGAVLCEDGDSKTLAALLQGSHRLGRATNTYGAVEIDLLSTQALDDWRETSSAEPAQEDALAGDGDRLHLTLISDLLVRDTLGQARPDAQTLAATLGRFWGLDPPPRVEQAFLSTGLRTGFNRTWGLPLPQEPVLTMGSVVVLSFTGDQHPDEEGLRQLEWDGLGDWRAEGFGRLLSNWSGERAHWTRLEPRGAPALVPAITSAAGQRLAQRMANHLGERVLEGAILRSALGPTPRLALTPPPPVSQLARLRAVVQNALLQETPTLAVLTEYLSALAKPAEKHLQRTRIGQQPFDDWLRQIADLENQPDQALQMLGLNSTQLTGIGTVQPEWNAVRARRVLLQLVDAVLARASKAQRRESAP